jgi:hypothetical protein
LSKSLPDKKNASKRINYPSANKKLGRKKPRNGIRWKKAITHGKNFISSSSCVGTVMNGNTVFK